MTRILNIAAYKFVDLDDLVGLRRRLLAATNLLRLKGTILLAEEGINLFLAGPEEAQRTFMREFREDPRFSDLVFKESYSKTIPFKRILVKLKKEIIRMNHPLIRPAKNRGQSISPATLYRWFQQGHDDAGRPLLLLDTRNEFELEQGRFQGAINPHIQKFSQFPEAVARLRDQLEGRAVVSYCTGGIRCEKATLYMNTLGLQNHWQLDGGILKYFEDVGGAFYEGKCTVFDQRHALDPTLCSVDEGHWEAGVGIEPA